ncbi:unnamed protein product, partial [Rotaria sp. Silwood1]
MHNGIYRALILIALACLLMQSETVVGKCCHAINDVCLDMTE